ncbi:beta-ketoacyl synthase N-terminal-like domain-containing protein [Actinosynnema sp. NPDC059797]
MTPPGTPVPVITGTGVRCAVADDVPTFADRMRAGARGAVRVVDDLDGPRAGAPLPPFDLAAALVAAHADDGVRDRARRAAHRAPPGVRAAVATVAQAWREAALDRAPLPADRVAVVVAGHNLTGGYADDVARKLAADPAFVPGRAALHLMDTDLLGVLTEVFALRGEGLTAGGASASGNVALITASRLLACDAADAVLVVGPVADPSRLERQALVNLGAVAALDEGADPAALCRPFDRGHRGFVPGQACAAVVLERPGSAARRGAPALAALAGHAARMAGTSLAHPSADGQVEVVTAALKAAGLDPADVDYVNAHATGTPLGDRTEAGTLLRVFGDGPRVNATKALTGHCLHAAGVLEAVAVVAQLRGGFLHPNPNLRDPVEPGLRYTGDRAEEVRARVALSNGFGFGGVTTSLVITDPEVTR